MQISVMITDEHPTVSLLDPENFTEFSLTAPLNISPEHLAQAVSEVGRLDGDGHVFVQPDKVRKLAGSLARTHTWISSFEGMIAYAESKGWTSNNHEIRAHIERR